MAKRVLRYLKKELMLTLSLLAAGIALIITPPTEQLLKDVDWHTLGTLLMMLCVLEGFKQENVLRPVVRLAGGLRRMTTMSLFLVFGVFFTSMFVTNDVSLIIFVPLTILLFRSGGKEKYILPVISMENIAAIRGSLLMPFGSPQNLFLYGQSGVSAGHFMLHMLPLCVTSALLLVGFIFFLYRKDLREEITAAGAETPWDPARKKQRVTYALLFALILTVIVSRTEYWYVAVGVVLATILIVDRQLLTKVDYVLLVTFLCFFVFSSSIAANETIAGVLKPTMGTVTTEGVIAPMLELGAGFNHNYSGRENIFLYAATMGFSRKFIQEKYEEIVDFSELGDFIDAPIKSYSSGMRARLGFSIATSVKPEVLILDEVLSVGDAAFREKSEKRLQNLMGDGVTVLYVSHSTDRVETLCTKAIILSHGQLIANGDSSDVCAMYREMVKKR